MTEISKKLKKVEEKVERAEVALKGISEMGEIAKRQALRDKVQDLLKAKNREEKEEVEKIVDVLMEF